MGNIKQCERRDMLLCLDYDNADQIITEWKPISRNKNANKQPKSFIESGDKSNEDTFNKLDQAKSRNGCFILKLK